MKKKHWTMLAAGAAIGIWSFHRDKKYPVCRELHFANKLVCPGSALQLSTMKLANWILEQMKLPEPPSNIMRQGAEMLQLVGVIYYATPTNCNGNTGYMLDMGIYCLCPAFLKISLAREGTKKQ